MPPSETFRQSGTAPSPPPTLSILPFPEQSPFFFLSSLVLWSRFFFQRGLGLDQETAPLFHSILHTQNSSFSFFVLQNRPYSSPFFIFFSCHWRISPLKFSSVCTSIIAVMFRHLVWPGHFPPERYMRALLSSWVFFMKEHRGEYEFR